MGGVIYRTVGNREVVHQFWCLEGGRQRPPTKYIYLEVARAAHAEKYLLPLFMSSDLVAYHRGVWPPHPAAQDEGLTSTLSQKHMVWQLELQNGASLLQACEDREIAPTDKNAWNPTRELRANSENQE